MKPLQVILDFLLSVACLFFRSKRKCKSDKPLVDGTGSPVRLPSESGDSPGGYRSHTDSGETSDAGTTTPVNMMGWALVIAGTGGYLFKLLIF